MGTCFLDGRCLVGAAWGYGAVRSTEATVSMTRQHNRNVTESNWQYGGRGS